MIRLPWFRVHVVLLNDPGRLISSHIIHTGLVSGWSAAMSFYELIVIDPTDPVYNPVWRQGSYVLPYATRLGVVRSIYLWSLGIDTDQCYWCYESVALAHLILSGLLFLASCWHWAYWDLDLFIASSSARLSLDLIRIFGIHLTLASITCLGFGILHLSGFLGPGFWTSDTLGIIGSIRHVKPVYSLLSLTPFCFGAVPSHHVSSGFLGSVVGIWHISTRPAPSLYKSASMSTLESVLASSNASIFFTSSITASLMWYGSITTPIELFGPSRYQWDNGFFSLDIERRVNLLSAVLVEQSWGQIPDKLAMYDYIGSNPAKGGLFRSGPMIKGDGIIQTWLGYATFEMPNLSLTVRRMPAFFETFPVVLVDQGGTIRSDIPFRRAESRYSIEQMNVSVLFLGGVLSGSEFSSPALVKSYARKAQFGQIFTFDRRQSTSDGVYRTSSRGWYSFAHTSFLYLFFFGHLWHASRALFRDLWTGLTMSYSSLTAVEYGRNEKLGESSTMTSFFV